jgi:hypothetical protein
MTSVGASFAAPPVPAPPLPLPLLVEVVDPFEELVELVELDFALEPPQPTPAPSKPRDVIAKARVLALTVVLMTPGSVGEPRDDGV